MSRVDPNRTEPGAGPRGPAAATAGHQQSGRSRRRPGRSSVVRPASALLAAGLLTLACTPPGLPAAHSPPAATASPSAAADTREIIIGVDGPVAGFNPYLVSDYSPAARAISALVLPSVSIPQAGGEVEIDQRVVTSAEVTTTDPFTVTYRIDRNAAWSDGTPVTAEDFRYLADQLAANNGTVGAAAYRLISEIRSTDAGKTVEVEFATPVAYWQELFSPLLPAHILKDAPGGFTQALTGGLPVSAGPYRVESVDRTTGLITLVRNDKYWIDQPGPATVVLRLGTAAELTSALDRGDIRALLVQAGSAAAEKLDARVPANRRVAVPMPATVQLVFDAADVQSPVSAPDVRRAIAAGLTPDVMADALTGSNPADLLGVNSFVELPSQQSDSAGVPPDPATGLLSGDQQAARAALVDAGYSISGLYATSPDGPLRISLAYPAGDSRLANAAKAVQQQLGGVGIEVNLARAAPGAVVQQLLDGAVDVALLTVPRGRSAVNAAVSAFGCPTESEPPVRAGNLGGYCSRLVDAALADPGATADDADLVTADRVLQRDLPVLPLGQPVAEFAVAADLAGVVDSAGPGWLWSGPIADLQRWPAN